MSDFPLSMPEATDVRTPMFLLRVPPSSAARSYDYQYCCVVREPATAKDDASATDGFSCYVQNGRLRYRAVVSDSNPTPKDGWKQFYLHGSDGPVNQLSLYVEEPWNQSLVYWEDYGISGGYSATLSRPEDFELRFEDDRMYAAPKLELIHRNSPMALLRQMRRLSDEGGPYANTSIRATRKSLKTFLTANRVPFERGGVPSPFTVPVPVMFSTNLRWCYEALTAADLETPPVIFEQPFETQESLICSIALDYAKEMFAYCQLDGFDFWKDPFLNL